MLRANLRDLLVTGKLYSGTPTYCFTKSIARNGRSPDLSPPAWDVLLHSPW